MTYKKTNRRDDDSRGSDRKFNSDKPKRRTSSSRTPAPKAGPFDKFDIKKMRDAKTESLEKKERRRPSDKKFRSLEDKKFRNLEDKKFRNLEGKNSRNLEDKNFRSAGRGERTSDRDSRSYDRNERGNRSYERNDRNSERPARGNRNLEDKKFRSLEDKNSRSGGRGERASDRGLRNYDRRGTENRDERTSRGRNDKSFDRPARGNREERSERPLRSSDRGERNTERGNRNLEDKKFRTLEDKKFRTLEDRNSRSGGRVERDTQRESRTSSRSENPVRENKRVRTTEKSSEKKEVSGFERKKTNPDEEIRLNRYIANSGVCSRRKADELIEKGEVTVNGEVIRELGYKVKYSDKIKFEGKLLKPGKLVYVLLNKPKDYITTMDDPMERRTVVDLTSKVTNERIFPVGRLDRNTTGLLLLTNDGDLADKLSHPRNQVKKVYEVELDKSLIAKDFEKVKEGVELEDGSAKVDQISYLDGKSKKFVGVEIHIGRNRIVRRIFESLGYEVVRLDRVIYAGLTKKDLPRGRSRMLTKEEIIYLKHLNKY